MSDTLIVCTGCFRHTRATDTACPFCHAPRASTPSLAAAAIVSAALVGGLALDASAQTIPARFFAQHSMAAGYGAAPRPFEPGTSLRGQAVVEGESATAQDAIAVATSAAVLAGEGARLTPRARAAVARGVGAFRACRQGFERPLTAPETHVVTVRWGGPRVDAPVSARGPVDRCIERAAQRLLAAGPPRPIQVEVRVTFSPSRARR
jgi:hypothetical protein